MKNNKFSLNSIFIFLCLSFSLAYFTPSIYSKGNFRTNGRRVFSSGSLINVIPGTIEEQVKNLKRIRIIKRTEVVLPGTYLQVVVNSEDLLEEFELGFCFFDKKYNKVASVGTIGNIEKKEKLNMKNFALDIHAYGTFQIKNTSDVCMPEDKPTFDAWVEIIENNIHNTSTNITSDLTLRKIIDLCYEINGLQNKLFTAQCIFPPGWRLYERNEHLEYVHQHNCSALILNNLDLPEREKQIYLSMANTAEKLESLSNLLATEKKRLQMALGTFEEHRGSRLKSFEAASPAASVYREAAPAIVSVSKVGPRQASSGKATGFLVSSEGHIFTSQHVVVPAVQILVTFSGGIVLPAKVVKSDDRLDLALLQVNLTEQLSHIKPLRLATLGSLEVGQFAMAIGNQGGFEKIVTAGIICGLQYSEKNLDRRPLYVISDAIINGGSSGGPLLNQEGEVVGINTFKSLDTQGLGFAVWVDAAQEMLDSAMHSSDNINAELLELWLYNDSFNKKEQVANALVEVLQWSFQKAETVMMQANSIGFSYCGTFPKPDATLFLHRLQQLDLQVSLKVSPFTKENLENYI